MSNQIVTMTIPTTDLPPALLHTRDNRGVHTLRLNRANTFNALSHDMLAALQAALDFVALDATAQIGRASCRERV